MLAITITFMFKRTGRILCLAMLFTPLLVATVRADGGQEIDASYHALWWSPNQMVGLDPNHPPKKATPVVLSKWEYSDPVGVPHPDIVTLVVTFKPNIVAASRVSVRTRWRVGRKWLKGPRVEAPEKSVAAGTNSVSFEIPVADGINRLSPNLLRSDVLVNGHVAAHADLPVQIGD
jgi:hypothetical protein